MAFVLGLLSQEEFISVLLPVIDVNLYDELQEDKVIKAITHTPRTTLEYL